MSSGSSHSTILATQTPSPYSSFCSGFEDTLERKAHCLGEPDGCMQPHLGWHGTQSNWSRYCSMSHSRSGFHVPLKEIIITVDNITHTHNHWLPHLIILRDSMYKFHNKPVIQVMLGTRGKIYPVVRSTCCMFVPKTSLTSTSHPRTFEILTKKFIALPPYSLHHTHYMALSTSFSQESSKWLPTCCKSWFYSSL